jgi:hypothetical protein
MITGPCTNVLDRVLIEFHIISQQDFYALSIKMLKIYTHSLPAPVDAEEVRSTFFRNVANTVLRQMVQNLQTGLTLTFNYLNISYYTKLYEINKLEYPKANHVSCTNIAYNTPNISNLNRPTW